VTEIAWVKFQRHPRAPEVQLNCPYCGASLTYEWTQGEVPELEPRSGLTKANTRRFRNCGGGILDQNESDVRTNQLRDNRALFSDGRII
jgi:hypothetical protein